MSRVNISALRKAISKDRYFITTHAKERMGLRRVCDEDLKYVVATGDVIEQYPDAQPFPKALFMAHLGGEPLYVSCALDGALCSHYYSPLVRSRGLDRSLDPEKEVAMPRTSKCAECGGTRERKIITYTHPWGEELYRFENVSALVCVQCGHVWLSAKTSQLMDQVVRNRQKPKKYQKIPVFSVAELARG